MVYDLIVVGASAAGVSASIYAARRKLNFFVLAKDIGGEVASSGEIENYPGYVHTDGIALTEKFKEQMEYNQVVVKQPFTATALEKTGNIFRITADGPDRPETFEAKAVIVGSGVHPKELGVPGEKELRGRGVTYCTTCDGPLFKNKKVVTVGGGNSALESALMLAEIGEHVWVINKNAQFKGEQILIDKLVAHPKVTIIYTAKTTGIVGEQRVTGVTYTDQNGATQELPVDGVFVHIGNLPNSGFVPAAKDTFQAIITDERAQTNIPGLFAAGDVTNVPYKQIGIAVGQGITAALSAIEYINRWKDA